MFAIKDEDLEPLIARELASSKVQHEEKFKNSDEAREIVGNEMEEVSSELDYIDNLYAFAEYQDANTAIDYEVDKAIEHSMLLVKEAIQAAAMCRKWKESGI